MKVFKNKWGLTGTLLAVTLGLFWLRRSSRLPALADRDHSTALLDTGATQLGRAISPLVVLHPGLCGIYPLREAPDAFAARMRLARVAERTLDVQYYIWSKDLTGTLLFEELHAAADRGVRVRLLLDDSGTSGVDPELSSLDSHPNIEVRLFNPFVIRNPRIGYVTDFFRANRRMHNKSFTADNQAAIIGGRNVGDDYFGAKEGLLYADFDVLAVGPVVTDVSHDFDRYWNSASSYPVDHLLPRVDSTQIEKIAAAAHRVEHDPAATTYLQALRDSPFVRQLVAGNLEMEWAATRMISDDPAKGLGRATPDQLFPQRLSGVVSQPSSHLEMVIAYFVPTVAGVDSLAEMAKRGVRIRIVTNSLEAGDGPWVHSGYVKHRKALLEAGITLYELRRLSPKKKGEKKGGSGPGSSDSSLHAKTFAVDGARIFVGSFNFDPRSAKLNTELGFVIDSPTLAQRIADTFDTAVPAQSYQVHLTDKGDIYWTEQRGKELVRYDKEPNTSFWLRAAVWFLSLLPIEWLL